MNRTGGWNYYIPQEARQQNNERIESLEAQKRLLEQENRILRLEIQINQLRAEQNELRRSRHLTAV